MRNMFLTRIWYSLNSITRARQTRALNGIYSPETFRQILERERIRADRYGGGFSLLAFDVGNKQREDDRVHRLAQVVANRLRTCDEVGWLDEQRLGVVLPGTPPKGARKLADDVCHAIAGSMPAPASKVYTYPSEWLPEIKGNSPNHPTTREDCDGACASAVPSDEMKMEDCDRRTEGIGLPLAPRIPTWKRALDIVGALLGFVLILPLFLLIAVFIKIVSPGPVFFKQERVGYLGKLFTCWKFRTMRVNADTSAHQQHLSKLIGSEKPMTKLDLEDDSRIIPLGECLRQLGLDELPQLINVVRGEMSLIGPRPCIPYEAREYLPWQRKRLDTTPGLTGLWQVSGKNRTTFNEMMRFDVTYARKVSFWLDVKIFLKTLPAILNQIADYLSNKKLKKDIGHGRIA